MAHNYEAKEELLVAAKKLIEAASVVVALGDKLFEYLQEEDVKASYGKLAIDMADTHQIYKNATNGMIDNLEYNAKAVKKALDAFKNVQGE